MLIIKDGCRLELQTPETMKSFGSTKELPDKIINLENIPNLGMVEVVLVQCNLVDNKYQQQSKILHILLQNKSDAYLYAYQEILKKY